MKHLSLFKPMRITKIIFTSVIGLVLLASCVTIPISYDPPKCDPPSIEKDKYIVCTIKYEYINQINSLDEVVISITHDPLLTFISSKPEPATVYIDTGIVVWELGTLKPYDKKSEIQVTFKAAPEIPSDLVGLPVIVKISGIEQGQEKSEMAIVTVPVLKSPTPTPIPPTKTSLPTLTFTPLPTFTLVSTPSSTSTATLTSTPLPTSTFTPTLTSTPTLTPTPRMGEPEAIIVAQIIGGIFVVIAAIIPVVVGVQRFQRNKRNINQRSGRTTSRRR
jgi:hypothetical protein